jgi:hypothetical protein
MSIKLLDSVETLTHNAAASAGPTSVLQAQTTRQSGKPLINPRRDVNVSPIR